MTLPSSMQAKAETVQTVATEIDKLVVDQVEKLIQDGYEIPSLNANAIGDLLSNGSRLVKFVGMVQDNSIPPELFPELFCVKENGQEVWSCFLVD